MNDTKPHNERNYPPTVHPYPGFISVMDVRAGKRLLTRNVRVWQEDPSSNDWFLEADAAPDSKDSSWREHVFEASGALYYRGQLVLVSLDGVDYVSRRESPEAIVFANGKERSIMDLGSYVGGLRDDGAIVFQTEVYRKSP
jgi:hypothetical protein